MTETYHNSVFILLRINWKYLYFWRRKFSVNDGVFSHIILFEGDIRFKSLLDSTKTNEQANILPLSNGWSALESALPS
jgi:hypothetical protein